MKKYELNTIIARQGNTDKADFTQMDMCTWLYNDQVEGINHFNIIKSKFVEVIVEENENEFTAMPMTGELVTVTFEEVEEEANVQ
jgi:hypothetical protein